MTNNLGFYALKIFTDLAKDIFFFPLWWYSYGLVELIIKQKEFIKDKEKKLALIVWIKNIFIPMYGQYDLMGHIISFLVRFFQIIIRSFFMLFWLLFCLFVLLAWLILPFLVLYEIFFQLFL
jgi:hypothetical protein